MRCQISEEIVVVFSKFFGLWLRRRWSCWVWWC